MDAPAANAFPSRRVSLIVLALALALPWGAAISASTAARDEKSHGLPWAKPGEVGVDPAGLEKLSAAMREMVDQGELPGVITAVARRGKLVHFQTYGKLDLESGKPVEDDSIFRIYSMTKPIAGVALMMLHDEGKLRLEDPVSKYLPELKGLKVAAGDGPDGNPVLEDAHHEMTIRELMSHTGGFTYGIFGRSQVDLLYQKANILDRDQTLEQFVEKLAKLPLLHQPGTKWQYSVSVDVQGRLIEVLSGKPFDAFLRERIFEPLGMKDTAFWVDEKNAPRFATLYVPSNDGKMQPQSPADYLTPPNFLSGGGGLVSTARDYLRFAQMLANDGELEGTRILKPGTVALMATNQLPAGADIGPIAPGHKFGLDFALIDQPREGVEHPRAKGEMWWFGIGGTWFGVNPSEDLVVLGMIQVRGGRAATKARLDSRRLAYAALAD
jgi:CubicO group peptidase (beta-lactamase class C family)